MSELLHEVYASSEPGTPESQRHVSPPTAVASVRIIRPRPIRHKRIGTSGITHWPHRGSRIWAGTILFWVAYIWSWLTDIILYGGNIITNLFAHARTQISCVVATTWIKIMCHIISIEMCIHLNILFLKSIELKFLLNQSIGFQSFNIYGNTSTWAECLA